MIFNNTARHKLNLYHVRDSSDSQGRSFPTGAIVGIVIGVLCLAWIIGICRFMHYYGDAGSSHSPTAYYRHNRTHNRHMTTAAVHHSTPPLPPPSASPPTSPPTVPPPAPPPNPPRTPPPSPPRIPPTSSPPPTPPSPPPSTPSPSPPPPTPPYSLPPPTPPPAYTP
ncbi:hypothetical protein GY45DRAFT_409811 [Cubamyces sp. BRFM 1775]|nr:hypothetical protein GY45DRAFT_409811 [Cubamyces sp. BRFM 1775]